MATNQDRQGLDRFESEQIMMSVCRASTFVFLCLGVSGHEDSHLDPGTDAV